MDIAFSFTSFIVLFGALQGYVLCVYLYQKRHLNLNAVRMFILFLFSISFFNMMYGFLDLDLFKYYRPLHVFPFPYKWLIGISFYFYIKNLFLEKNQSPFHIKYWWWFLPAIIYGIMRLYWFVIAAQENSYRIIQVIVESNYFRIQEFVYLLFNIILGLALIGFLNKQRLEFTNKPRSIEVINWLKKLVVIFISISVLNLFLFIVDLILHDGKETFLFLYPNLFINVAFIYWIGYVGFSKPKMLFYQFLKNKKSLTNELLIKDKLMQLMIKEKVYRNPKLTINDLAYIIQVPPKELSSYINEFHHCNFSEYLNNHRIKYVLHLLGTEEASKYTLISLAEEAGFNSKSNFNATFKRIVGSTPSDYKKQLDD